MDALAELLGLQDGVIARRQVLACGLPPAYVARRLRRRDWVPVHPGVYVSHTGPPTWRQRVWAAVLACGVAALDGWSGTSSTAAGHRAGDRSSSSTAAKVGLLLQQQGWPGKVTTCPACRTDHRHRSDQAG